MGVCMYHFRSARAQVEPLDGKKWVIPQTTWFDVHLCLFRVRLMTSCILGVIWPKNPFRFWPR